MNYVNDEKKLRIMENIESKSYYLPLNDTLTIVQDTEQIHRIFIEPIKLSSTSGDFETIGVVSGAIAALAALATICLTYHNNKRDREAKRPYFTIVDPGFKQIKNNLRLQITFINNGNHPAKEFKGEIQIFQEDVLNVVKIDIDIVNDIPPNYPTPYYNDSVVLTVNMPRHFIYCNISYLDPILKKKYHQEFFMKWDGVQNWVTHPDFVHVDKSEKNIIQGYVKSNTLEKSKF